MKIALVSLNPEWENKDHNKLKIVERLETVSFHYPVEWFIFPEMTLTGFTMNTRKCAEDFHDSPSIRFFQEQAVNHRTYLSFGVILKCGDKATNNLITVSPAGEIIASYAKIHPFSYAGENSSYHGGDSIVNAEISNIRTGMSICYDLRFPEMFQVLSKACEIIVNIACWPDKRVEHWNTLLRARAIENQVFMIGVNRTGKDGNNLNYVKSSMLVSPEGKILQGEKIGEETDVYEIDLNEVNVCRKSFPVKNDRKIELYKRIL
ncbi:MAG: hypothetical protein LBD59_04790 [Prevotellaceae bacterium]|jgi:predicted amidohydrolase|nr:hypothetical protein [Prevotellaceae bacterium]